MSSRRQPRNKPRKRSTSLATGGRSAKVVDVIIRSNNARRRAVQTIQDRVTARTTKGPEKSRMRLVRRVLSMDGSRHPLPVDVSSLTLLAAVLGECRMRSAEQYISSARKWHVTSGHPWTQQLDQVQRDLGRALKRGRGPPSKAAELRWKDSIAEFKKQGKHPTQEAMQTWTS